MRGGGGYGIHMQNGYHTDSYTTNSQTHYGSPRQSTTSSSYQTTHNGGQQVGTSYLGSHGNQLNDNMRNITEVQNE